MRRYGFILLLGIFIRSVLCSLITDDGDSQYSAFLTTPLGLDVHIEQHDGYFHLEDSLLSNYDQLLTDAKVVLAVIDSSHHLKKWIGAVDYVQKYDAPAPETDMLTFWAPYDDILFTYRQFKKKCDSLTPTKECSIQHVVPIGLSYYEFYFRGVPGGMTLLRIIEKRNYGKERQTNEQVKTENEARKNLIVSAISHHHLTPLMILDTSVDEISTQHSRISRAVEVYGETLKSYLEKQLQRDNDLQEVLQARTALSELQKRQEHFSHAFKKHVHSITSQTAELRQKTLNMLDYSEICSGNLALAMRDKINLIDIIQSAHDLYRHSANAKNVGFLTRINAGIFNPYIRTDATRFRQSLYGLLENAVKYSHQNGAAIELSFTMSEEAGIKFCVKDYGVGISDANKAVLCQAFEGHDADRKDQASLRLSLFLCRHFIEAMGGGLEIESQESVYTKAVITLPLSLIASHDTQLESLPYIMQTNVLEDVQLEQRRNTVTDIDLPPLEALHDTLLYSEDNTVAGLVVQRYSKKLCKIEWYTDGEKALEAYRKNPNRYFMALLDFYTPDARSGDEIGLEIKKINPNTPVVILTANENEKVKNKCKDLDSFLNKPIKLSTFQNEIAKARKAWE